MQSCGDENNPVNSGPPFIESISKATTFVGDTITVFGANLGARSDSSYVLIDTLRFSSHDCLKWTAAVVALEVPIGASSGTFAIVTDGVMSNKLQISVAPLPPYETVQVSAGSFMMGSATGLADESPVHEVTLTRGLEVAATEVTLQLWNSVMHDMPKEMTAKNLPVAGIEWAEAV
ncbi:MAG: SUMF1/EgtB/PvdO family nonheme iron enzyme, partial [Candidatus Kapaibacterium sp.]